MIMIMIVTIIHHQANNHTDSNNTTNNRSGGEARRHGLRRGGESVSFWKHLCSGKDKGGPSKGGFLNNQLFSYTVLSVCNDMINRLFRRPPLLGPPLSCANIPKTHFYYKDKYIRNG